MSEKWDSRSRKENTYKNSNCTGIWARRVSKSGKGSFYITFIMEFGFCAKKIKRPAKDRISIYQSVSFAKRAKKHASPKLEFRRPSRDLERARKYRDGNKWPKRYACSGFSASEGPAGLRSGQRKKVSITLEIGLVLIYAAHISAHIP